MNTYQFPIDYDQTGILEKSLKNEKTIYLDQSFYTLYPRRLAGGEDLVK